ncbi:RES family NAD+ phosphorylase [Synechococcus sp. CS-1328]|uniref:RES family NAD+ phosphorylase n=1 Tax=Synechococcus sp. CS-1328 TaxID=2847976 RepID=UPI00223AE455|nr:RES family NAD+ phosphorylase [Synechococcus sp. CS-1328]MCT0224863.1 RES family NAD+ phosphorylase [Synechococcus sp. CS-1328]
MVATPQEQAPFRLGFRVCDRRYPFLWHTPGQQQGRWNRAGDQPVHVLASTPTLAWAEWIRHQEIHDPQDLDGIAAALWAVLLPAAWGAEDLPAVTLPLDVVLGTTERDQQARQALVDQLRQQGAQGLKAPSAALHQSHSALPCVRVCDGAEVAELLPIPAEVILLWCPAEQLPGWCCVPQGRPGPELLPLVRREGMLAG